jgi:predicted dithiol-disulfide oxidoreductase (DUF899 family)
MSIPTPPTSAELETHPVVGPDQWLDARKQLLAEEKQALRRLDEVHRKRRALPWERVKQNYQFEGPEGPVTLSDLFRGRSQLIIYHFMFAPGWKEGCDGCSFLCDHVDGARQHFEHHDVAFAAVSRAPLAEFLPFKKRMGWNFPWLSSRGTSFNYDFGVSFTLEQLESGNIGYNYGTTPYAHEELHGLSVFYRRADGSIYHTYSTYARGVESLVGALQFLDLTPKGRNESRTMNWIKHHDRYETVPNRDAPACGCDGINSDI